MIAAITGHRTLPNSGAVQEILKDTFNTLGVQVVYQGMCKGTDYLAAKAAYESGIPYVAVKPWAGHKYASFDYDLVLERAEEVYTVDYNTNYPGPYIYQKRNEFMVDSSDTLIAVWNGDRVSGTWNCMEYALREHRAIYRINPYTLEVGWVESVSV